MRRQFESEISMRISKFHCLSQSYQRTDGHPFEPYVYFKVIILMEIGYIKMYSSIRWRTDGVLVLNQWWPFWIYFYVTARIVCRVFLIWLKTNGVPSFHLESIRPFWFTRSCRFDSFIRSPFENVVPFSFKWAPAELL